jgi:zearalenone synthase (highly reducing iterative type I polyketide synthase)
VTRTLLSIGDLRLTELDNDDDQGNDGAEVTPAEITSEVRWNYELDLINPDELANVISRVRREDRAAEVCWLSCFLLHLPLYI